ncbi:MAG: chromosome segregation SMC family protein [Ilumatobacteraceae bacterium]
MFLKSLTLKGFKSFADTTVMELEPGVTVVVGPNGSGKSNVVDAIAWVLGAQAPSAVRSQKMDDVIFAGTAKRPALGRAEVTLTIDNSAGLLPIEFTEVTVSRTLFRSGESAYAINGIECRLLDVQELLSDAGVGRQQHVIVSQGQIDAVLNARPEDRRAIIEEASGVLKHRKRREKAQRRLDNTEADLMRAQDLLREVRRNLRPLERQADAARRHDALAAELHNVQVFLTGREISGFQKRLTNLATDKLEGEQAERALRARLSALDTAVMADEALLSARGDSGVNDELVRIEQLRGRARGLLAVLAERRRSVERDRGQLMDSGVIATLEADAAALRTELQKVIEQLVAIEAVETPDSDDGISSLEDARSTTQKVNELNGRVRGLNEEIDRLKAVVASEARAEIDLLHRLAAADSARISAESALDVAFAVHTTAASDSGLASSQMQALRSTLETTRAGSTVLRDLDGAVGSLVDLLEIDGERRSAVQVALGDSLAAMVTTNADAARRALQLLRQGGHVGAVLALNAIATVPITPIIDKGMTLRSGVRAKVGEHEVQINRLLDVLLSRVVYVQSWTDAVDVALAHPDVVVVTGDGDRFSSSGMKVGASTVTAAALDEATHRAQRASEEFQNAENDLAAARMKVVQTRDSHTAALNLLERHRGQAAQSNERLAIGYDALRSVQAELQALLSVLRNDLEVKTAGLQERRQFLESRLADVETRLSADADARDAAAVRRRRVEASLNAIVRLAYFVEGRNATLDARQATLQEVRRRQSDEVRSISQRLDESRRERSGLEQQLDGKRERNRRVEIEEAEVRMRLEAAVDSLRRDQQVEPQVAIDTPMPILPEGITPISRLRELERELRMMGPINPLALEEFDELQTRHTFLEEQLEDVKNSRRELIKVIKQVDLEIQSVFAAAFADVRDNFEKLFAMLFPGGVGKLTLTMPDDLLNTGIEIEAKPSGKNIKKLSLLSGGERSLAALAFLFAVFRSRPSPFYVMDEVEAALDDVNLHRFLNLVDEFRQEAQLLIVSHQKRTMEAGDCLLGVTMQPGGSSRVIVERAAAKSA